MRRRDPAGGPPKVRLLILVTIFVLALAPASSAAGRWSPPQRLTFFWQLQGKVHNDEPVAAYDIDGFENDAGEVAALHAQGKRVICYIDAGTAENFRPDYSQFPKSVLGRSNGWPGEKWLDIRQTATVEPIMLARFRMCAEKGFDAVEPDNIEAFSNKSGFEIGPQQQLAYNEWIAEAVHSLGMAALQKNDGEQSRELQPFFDGVLNEECNRYKECADYAPYLAAGKPVLNAEYGQKNAKFCPSDEAAGIMGARFAKSLNGKKFIPCWGALGLGRGFEVAFRIGAPRGITTPCAREPGVGEWAGAAARLRRR